MPKQFEWSQRYEHYEKTEKEKPPGARGLFMRMKGGWSWISKLWRTKEIGVYL